MEARPTPSLVLDESQCTSNPGTVDDKPRSPKRNEQKQTELDTAAIGTSKAPAQQQQQSEDPPTPSRFPKFPLPSMITTEHGMLHPDNLTTLALGRSGYLYKCLEGCAYKARATQREVDLMAAAGDCAVAPLSLVLRHADDGGLVPSGLVMELAAPVDFALVPAGERRAVMHEMVGLVERLHGGEVGIAHGDIRPASFLRCRDGRLRLCGFESARLIADGGAEGWEGRLVVSERYRAPSRRGFPAVGPPQVVDEEYALAVSVWELFTGKDVSVDGDMEQALKEGWMGDLEELEDNEVREFVRKRLRDGGAKV